MNEIDLIRIEGALRRVGEPPCEEDGGCPEFERCRRERVACAAFRFYVGNGRKYTNPFERGEPDRDHYDAIYPPDEPEEDEVDAAIGGQA